MITSLATGCMNRAASLKLALASWLVCKKLDEVVVVDWSSEVPLYEELNSIVDSRLRIVRVESQAFWCAARCHNVEINAATGDNLLRIDSDVKLDATFFEEHPIHQNDFFWNAWWKNSCGDDCHLFGTVYTKRKNFLLVNGYNERLQSYGFEDEDIYLRLQKANIRRREANRRLLSHIPHDINSRLCHLNPDFAVDLPIKGVGLNLKIAEALPWTVDLDRMSEWNIECISDRLQIYRPKTQPCTVTRP